MAEVLEALLQLNIDSFTAALSQAASQVTAFAQAISGSIGSTAQVFQQQVQAINQVATATQKATQTQQASGKQRISIEEEVLRAVRLAEKEWQAIQDNINRNEREKVAVAKKVGKDRVDIDKLTAATVVATWQKASVDIENIENEGLTLHKQKAKARQELSNLEVQNRIRDLRQEMALLNSQIELEIQASATVLATWLKAGKEIDQAEAERHVREEQRSRMRMQLDNIITQNNIRNTQKEIAQLAVQMQAEVQTSAQILAVWQQAGADIEKIDAQSMESARQKSKIRQELSNLEVQNRIRNFNKEKELLSQEIQSEMQASAQILATWIKAGADIEKIDADNTAKAQQKSKIRAELSDLEVQNKIRNLTKEAQLLSQQFETETTRLRARQSLADLQSQNNIRRLTKEIHEIDALLDAQLQREQRRIAFRREINNLQATAGIKVAQGGVGIMDPAVAFNLQKLQGFIDLTDEAIKHGNMFDNAIARIGSSLRTLGSYIAASAIIGIPIAFAQWARESVNVALQMQSLQATFVAINGSVAKANEELAFLRQTAQRVGVDFLQTATQFRNLEAAARGTSLEGNRVRGIFEAVVTATRVMGLSSEQTARALLALEQMISKGTITAEELRKQLAQAIPGSVNIMARALGVGTEELAKMMKAGDLLSTDVLPRFAAQMQREFGPGLERASRTAQASFARLGNEVRDISAAMGNAILTVLKPAADLITTLLQKAREAGEAARKEIAKTGAEVRAGKPVTGYAGTTLELAAGATEEEELKAVRLVERIAEVRQMLINQDKMGGWVPEGIRSGLSKALKTFEQELGMKLPAALDIPKQTRAALDAYEEEFRALNKVIEARDKASKQADLMDEGGGVGGRAETGARIVEAQKRYEASVKEVLELHKSLPTEIQKAVSIAKALPDVYESAEERLKAVKKLVGDYREMLEKNPNLRLDPAVQAAEKKTAAIAKAAQDEIDAAKEKKKLDAQMEAEDKARRNKLKSEEEQRQRDEERITADFQKEIAKQTEGETEGKLVALQTQLDEARKKKVEETVITAYEASRRVAIYAEEAEKSKKFEQEKLTAIKKRASDAEAAEEIIAKISAKGTKTRVDDFNVELEKAIETMQARIDKGEAFEEDMTRLAEAGAARRSLITREEADKASKEQNRVAKEAARPLRELATTLENTLAGVFKNALSGSKTFFEGIRDGFLDLLAKLAADAIANAIIIPAIISIAGGAGGGSGGGGGGLLGALGLMAAPGAGIGGGGGGGGGIVQQAVGLASSASSISGALGGPSATSLLGGSSAGSLINMPIGDLAGSALGLEGGVLGIGGASISQIAAPIGLGVAVGQILSMLNHLIGLRGAGSDALAGAGGGAAAGALAGSTIFPGIGTAIGALGGALLGAFTAGISAMRNDHKEQMINITRGLRTLGVNELLGRGSKGGAILEGIVTAGTGFLFSQIFGPKKEPAFQMKELQVGRVQYDDVVGLRVEQDFKVLRDFHEKLGVKYEEFIGTVNDSMNVLFHNVVEGFQGASPDIKRTLVEPLNRIFAEIGNQILGYQQIGGDNMKEELQVMLTEHFPKIFADAANGFIAEFMAAVEKISPVIDAFNKIIDSLTVQIEELMEKQLALHLQLEGNIKTIYESLMAPAEILIRRKEELAVLVKQFDEGNEATKIMLAPKIGELAIAIMDLSKTVSKQSFGDITGIQGGIKTLQESLFTPAQNLAARQADLTRILNEFRGGTDSVRTVLAPQITQLALQIMELSKGVITLAEQQALLADFPLQMRAITEALFSPAQSYLSERQQLIELMGKFRAGTPEQQIGLEPQIAQLAAQIMQRARGEDVLGQDPQLLRQQQAELVNIMTEVQNTISSQSVGQNSDAAMLQATLERTQAEMIGVLREVEYVMAGSIVAAGQQTIQAIHSTAGAIISTDWAVGNGVITAQYYTANGVVSAQYNSAGQLIGTQHYIGGYLYNAEMHVANTVAGWSNWLVNLQGQLIGQVAYSRDLAWYSYVQLQNALWTEIGIAQQEIQILLNSLYHLETVDAVVARALGVLGEMNARLGNPLRIDMAGSIGEQLQRDAINVAQQSLRVQQQGTIAMIGLTAMKTVGMGWEQALGFGSYVVGVGKSFQHGGQVPFNGMAYLHQGERVVPEWENRNSGGGAKAIHINVYGGNKDASAIADEVIQVIERRAGRLQSTTIQTTRR